MYEDTQTLSTLAFNPSCIVAFTTCYDLCESARMTVVLAHTYVLQYVASLQDNSELL